MIARKARTAAVALLCLLAAGCPNSAGITCPPGQSYCNGACITVAADARNCGGCGKICPDTLACIDGSCGCPGGLTECNQRCIDTNVDGNNCGSCGKACGAGTACVNGSCGITCGPNLTVCGAQCIDTQNDGANCGMCGMACPAFTICCGGQCVGTLTSQHCGSCLPCPAGFSCVSDGPTCIGP